MPLTPTDDNPITGYLARTVLRLLWESSVPKGRSSTIVNTPGRVLNQRQKRRDARRAGRPVKPRRGHR